MRGGSSFTFESVELMDYKIHETNLKRGGSYIESPEWLKNKGATINPKNKKDDKCFQYALTLALNYNKIKKKSQKKYLKKLNVLSHQRVQKTKQQNNESIALNVLFSS